MPLMTALQTLRNCTLLTVTEYSKITGVAVRTIQIIEAGRVNPTIKTADKLLQPLVLAMGVCSKNSH